MCSRVVFEKSAVLVLLKKEVLPCAVHRALHLFRERFWRFCHLISDRSRQVTALPFCWHLPCNFCDCPWDAPQVVKDAAEVQMKMPIFAKQKARNAEHKRAWRLIKTGKGAKYGIPDSSCRRINDGALRADHSGLLKAA
jgi:hypothetical protein